MAVNRYVNGSGAHPPAAWQAPPKTPMDTACDTYLATHRLGLTPTSSPARPRRSGVFGAASRVGVDPVVAIGSSLGTVRNNIDIVLASRRIPSRIGHMFEGVCAPTVAAVQAADPSTLAGALFRVSQDALGAMSADEAECVIAATQRILNAVTARQSAALTRYTEHVLDTRDAPAGRPGGQRRAGTGRGTHPGTGSRGRVGADPADRPADHGHPHPHRGTPSPTCRAPPRWAGPGTWNPTGPA